MNQAEVIIAMNNAELASRMRSVLNSNGYHVIDLCVSGNEVIRKIRMMKPEAAIINYELPDTNGLEVAKIIGADKLCSVVLLTNETQREYAENITNDMDVVCLNRPFSKMLLLNTLDLVMRSRRRIRKLEGELTDLRKSLETRKLVDKAKGLLIDKLGLTEPEAYRKIQKQSMDSGVAMRDIAKIIIDTMQ